MLGSTIRMILVLLLSIHSPTSPGPKIQINFSRGSEVYSASVGFK